MREVLENVLGSDIFLSCLLILLISMLSLRLFPFSLRNLTNALRSIALRGPINQRERALGAFHHYGKLSLSEIDLMKAKYASIGRRHKRIGYDLGYPEKLARLEEATKINARITSVIANMALKDGFKLDDLILPSSEDLSKVREVLRHVVRDWSEESQGERAITFAPILDKLKSTEAPQRGSMKVLVPGSGLGRLGWEISRLGKFPTDDWFFSLTRTIGFDTTANELSPYMNLAFRCIFSSSVTEYPSQHTIHPYAHWFSHQMRNSATFRAVKFPDDLPRLSNTFHLLDGDFLKIDRPEIYDYVITQFFIDTSLNVISTLEQIHRLLKPGGEWINLGPLLWTGGSQAALELSLEEVLSLAGMLGFEVDPRSRKTIDCEYTADREAMMKWIYRAEFWVAKKRTEQLA